MSNWAIHYDTNIRTFHSIILQYYLQKAMRNYIVFLSVIRFFSKGLFDVIIGIVKSYELQLSVCDHVLPRLKFV